MAWWDSSQPNWLKNLMPSYAHELEEVREELETQLEILTHHPGNQRKVSEKLLKTAASMTKIQTLGQDIAVYFPDHPFVARRHPKFFQVQFPRYCQFYANTFITLSRKLLDEPGSEEFVANQVKRMLEKL
ncbi:uncharacterized protein N7515_008359 [Penicillium bovifimosum]|uniref:Uncharacterized protein n=1 Tax=Penicillium bovifimosum TaxID=126998 RepID=A0A9W9GN56_9EURO|nr:uncharacterized protein N7515_008359 [Penicillium bovifimosum]KAJ5124534.1 hypothetical protein N7515_008359 [Penicillium bovifimosum]